MPSPPAEQGSYEALNGESQSAAWWSLSRTKVMIGTGGVLTLLLVIAVVVGLSVDVSHRDWKGCDEDYWRRGCRLNREGDGYNNFLARADLLLPRVIHRFMSEEELGTGRILMMGDVHGCRDEFLELLEKAKFEQGVDTLILAGDLVDKGPYSVQVIQEARKMGALSVRGNHDDSGLAAYEAFTRGEEVEDKHDWVKGLEPEDASWLAHLPWTISLPSHGLTVVHAGLVPEIPLEHQLLPDLYHMREVGPGDDTQWRGMEGKPERGLGTPWAQVWDGPQHVVFGHDSKKGLQEEAFATGIDTGVVSGSYLTGLLLPGAKDLQERPGDGSGPMTLAKLHGKFIRVKAKKNYLAAGHDECMPYRLCRE